MIFLIYFYLFIKMGQNQYEKYHYLLKYSVYLERSESSS